MTVRLISAPPWCNEPALLASEDSETRHDQSGHSRGTGPPGASGQAAWVPKMTQEAVEMGHKSWQAPATGAGGSWDCASGPLPASLSACYLVGSQGK